MAKKSASRSGAKTKAKSKPAKSARKVAKKRGPSARPRPTGSTDPAPVVWSDVAFSVALRRVREELFLGIVDDVLVPDSQLDVWHRTIAETVDHHDDEGSSVDTTAAAILAALFDLPLRATVSDTLLPESAPCECGHPESAHDDRADACSVAGCDCVEYERDRVAAPPVAEVAGSSPPDVLVQDPGEAGGGFAPPGEVA